MRLARLEPEGCRLLRGHPRDRTRTGANLRVRRHAPKAQRLRARRQRPGSGRRGDPGRHPGRQELGPPYPEGARNGRRGKRGDDRRHGRLPEGPRPRGDLRRRAFLRWPGRKPGVRPRHAAGGGRCGRGLRGSLRHERRHPAVADRGGDRRGARGTRPGCPDRHSHPRRRRLRRSQLAGGGAGRRGDGPGHDQRLRRAGGEREPGHHRAGPAVQDGVLLRSRRQPPRTDRALALRRGGGEHRP